MSIAPAKDAHKQKLKIATNTADLIASELRKYARSVKDPHWGNVANVERVDSQLVEVLQTLRRMSAGRGSASGQA